MQRFVAIVLAVLLAAFATGIARADASIVAGDLLQVPGREEVWLVDSDGNRHWIADLLTFNSLGLGWDRLRHVDGTTLESVLRGVAYVSGGVVRDPADDRVYVHDGQQRRWVQNLEIFSGLSLTWDMVQTGTPGMGPLALPEGSPILLLSVSLAPQPQPPQPYELISSTGIAVGDQCLGDWDSGVQWAGELPGNPLPETFCYVVAVDRWQQGWTLSSRWNWPGGTTDQTSTQTPCPTSDCGGGYIKQTLTNPEQYYRSAGEVTIDFIVNDSVVRTDTFSVGIPLSEPDLEPAWHTLRETEFGRSLSDTERGRSVRVVFRELPPSVNGRYTSEDHTISVGSHLRSERSVAIAALLGHELHHVNFWDIYAQNPEGCVQREVDAFGAGAFIWGELRPVVPVSLFEVGLEEDYWRWIYGGLEDKVRSLYHETCGLAA